MIEEVLPPGVVSVSMTGDVEVHDLYPEEEELVRRAVPKRRGEFATARSCARRALRELGVPPGPILATSKGAPRWPAGTVGSMTHCDGFRAAAVARERDLPGLGIDAEPDGPVPQGVLDAIALPSERLRLDRLRRTGPRVNWDRLLFSAKESVYKAWHPLTGRWLGFMDAELDIDPWNGTFEVRVRVSSERALPGFRGRWAARDGLLVTAVTVGGSSRSEGCHTSATTGISAGEERY